MFVYFLKLITMEKQNFEKIRKVFTHFEKEILLNLVDDSKHVIENKCTNGTTNYLKSQEWRKITRLFNATPGVNVRDDKQLKCFYFNLKRRALKECAERKVEIFKTGGGPSIPAIGPTAEKLAAMGVMRKPLKNMFDSDFGYHNIAEEEGTSVSADAEFPNYDGEETIDETQEEAVEYPKNTYEPDPSPSMSNGLKTPVSRWKMIRKKKTPTTADAATAIAEERRLKATDERTL